MAKCQTWVIIVKLKAEEEVPSRYALVSKKRLSGLNIETSNAVLIDRPVLIIPDGEAEKIEIIPITGPAIIHGTNFERRLNG